MYSILIVTLFASFTMSALRLGNNTVPQSYSRFHNDTSTVQYPFATALFMSCFDTTLTGRCAELRIGDPCGRHTRVCYQRGGFVVGNRKVSLALVLPFCSALSIFTMRRHISADIKRLVLWLAVVRVQVKPRTHVVVNSKTTRSLRSWKCNVAVYVSCSGDGK
jgi:hypothetical protein